MDSKEYQRRVLETESKPEEIKFGTLSTYAVLKLISSVAEVVDVAKKAMFYGREVKLDNFQLLCDQVVSHVTTLHDQAENGTLCEPDDIKRYDGGHFIEEIENLDLGFLNKRLLHATIGCNSETGELADALLTSWIGRTPVDRVNFAEEVGDGLWYQAIASDELGMPFTTLFDQNITKLQDKSNGRYCRGSFDPEAANFRNLEQERLLLEQSTVQEVAPEMMAALTEVVMSNPLTQPATPVTPAMENQWSAYVRANEDGSYTGLDLNGIECCRMPFRSAVIQTLDRHSKTIWRQTSEPAS